MRDAGYAGTELGDWGFLPTDPETLRRELAARGLALAGAFVPVAFADGGAHAAGEEAALRTARLLAAAAGAEPFIVLADQNGEHPVRTRLAGRIGPEHALTGAQWETFALGVDRVARSVRRETGLRCVFHHHAAGFVETPAEVERLLELTDPDLVGLCFDTGHYRLGGGDPLEGFRRHLGRIRHVHFKDSSPRVHEESRRNGWGYFDSLKHGIFCELGKGAIDFAALVAELRGSGYRGWIVVEQDVLPGMGAPGEYARRNREFLRSCGL
ncbi:MAG: TIM barrel protein [Planctomycetes bacterium]|nr:TIM barrel protein [Planctomycetota bacterium]